MAGPARAQLEVGEGTGELEVVEVAILLDTSNSMQPLIDAARVGLWDIVNDLARLKPKPVLRVALVGYGGRMEDPKAGFVTVRSALTGDLDAVSEQLFELTTGGGTEYVGRALAIAMERLEWPPPGREALRLIFIAGNEPADQDPETDLLATGRAADAGEFGVFAIYCGQGGDQDAQSWRGLAEAARGQFATLNLNAASRPPGTSFDRELAELGNALNATYVPYGDAGKAGRKTQAAQDKRVAALSPAAAAARAETKAGALYEPEWDLVGAVVSGRLDLATVAPESLPRALRGLTSDELAAWVQRTWLERQQLQMRILALGDQRRQYLEEQARVRGTGAGPATFESIVRDAIRQELEERGFRPAAD